MTAETLPRPSPTETLKTAFGPRALPALFAAAGFYLLFVSGTGQLGWEIPGPLSSAFLAVLLFGAAAVTVSTGKPSVRRARIVAGLIKWAALFTLCTLIKLVLEAASGSNTQPVHTSIAALVMGASAVIAHLTLRKHGHTEPSEDQQ